MVILGDLMAFPNDLMGDVGDKDPHMPNGLQVRGREEVKLLATGVSASLRFPFEHELSLIAYHYLLDSHPEVGHNVRNIEGLQAEGCIETCPECPRAPHPE